MPTNSEQKPKRQWGPINVFKRRWWAFFLGGLVAAPALGLAIAALVTYWMPREYLGRVRLQIQPFSQNYEVFRDNSTRQMLTPTFIQTQFQIITSKETLHTVIEELQLVKKWEDAKSPSDAYAMLLDKINTQEVRGTDLIDIEIYHTDPHEAAELANAIGKAYQKRRTENETSRRNNALDMLNAQETLQEQKVEDARLRMLELMEKFHIVDLGTGSPAFATEKDYTGVSSKEVIMASRMSSLLAEQEISTIQSHIEALEGLEGDNLIEEAIALNVIDDTIAKLFQEKPKLTAQIEAMRNSGIGPQHPDVKRMESQLDEVDRLLESCVENVKHSLQTRLSIAQKSLENLQAIEEEKKEDSMPERKSYTQYVEAKRAYETQNLILTDMRQALLIEKVDLSLPRSSVEIHETAEPSPTPARPNVPINLLVGFLAGGVLLFLPVGIASMYVAHAVLRP